MEDTVRKALSIYSEIPEKQRDLLAYTDENTTLTAYRGNNKVVVITDSLMTSGRGRVEQENVNKIEILGERALMACCGYAAPAEIGARIVRELFAIYWSEYQKDMPPQDMATRIGEVAMLIFQCTGLDFYPLFVAYDEKQKRSRIFDVWPSAAGAEKQDFWTNGSGGQDAFSYIRLHWRQDMNEEAELMLGVAAVHFAQHKVTSANNPHRIAIVSAEPVYYLPLEKVQALLDQCKAQCPDCGYQSPARGYIQP